MDYKDYPPVQFISDKLRRIAFNREILEGWKPLCIFILAALIPICIPVVNILIFIKLYDKRPVDEYSCECSCWDTIFKGAYEDGLYVRYKHVYFNSNANTLKMWISTAFFLLFFYETFKRFLSLLFKNQIRWSTALGVIFPGSLHNLYYAWWNHWNHWNDDYYRHWNHQLVFTISEWISYLLLVLSVDRSVPIQPLKMLGVGCISVFHVLASGVDQFVVNVVFGQGMLHQVLRDVMFMSTDIVFIAISVYELRKYAVHKMKTSLSRCLGHSSHLSVICVLFSVQFLCYILLPVKK